MSAAEHSPEDWIDQTTALIEVLDWIEDNGPLVSSVPGIQKRLDRITGDLGDVRQRLELFLVKTTGKTYEQLHEEAQMPGSWQ